MEKTYSDKEIVDYYDQTEVHYKAAWKLDEAKAMHYGFWVVGVKTFAEALLRMNDEMMQLAEIKNGMKILDAGCGVGGSVIHMTKKKEVEATGITLSKSQVASAIKNAEEEKQIGRAHFLEMNACQTDFPDNTFDVVWGLESFIHIEDKQSLFEEVHRILKPGGCLVVGDYFMKEDGTTEREYGRLMKWLNRWAIGDIISASSYTHKAESVGLKNEVDRNITGNIRKSSWRMFYGSIYLSVISFFYRLYNPKVRSYADNHWKAMWHQYIALRKGLWTYRLQRYRKDK